MGVLGDRCESKRRKLVVSNNEPHAVCILSGDDFSGLGGLRGHDEPKRVKLVVLDNESLESVPCEYNDGDFSVLAVFDSHCKSKYRELIMSDNESSEGSPSCDGRSHEALLIFLV
jgi:hypothetical protein